MRFASTLSEFHTSKKLQHPSHLADAIQNNHNNTGQCWGDTACDTALGHGIYYDRKHPQHSRFCGSGWSDANDQCAPERHCPSGDDADCPAGEECYAFLANCNYVDMIGGPENAIAGGSDGPVGSSRLPLDDPSRSNFCGSDWNDAVLHCSSDDHWCPSGADGDCPRGKVCYAGTDCLYVADLRPTTAPTDEPTASPTFPPPTASPSTSPVMRNDVVNTRFCGEGWEDARATCRIGSHCPSGHNTDCHGDRVCMGHLAGCNIVDFSEYLAEKGVEIFGADHWLLPAADGTVPKVDAIGTPLQNVAPTAALAALSRGKEAASSLPPAIPTPPSVPEASSPGITPPPLPPLSPSSALSAHIPSAADHVFCGRSYADAVARCSPATHCVDGAATHDCGGQGLHCWVGVAGEGCDAALWAPTRAPTLAPTTSRPTVSPTVPPTAMPTLQPSRTLTTLPTMAPQRAAREKTEGKGNTAFAIATSTIRQSYCATSYKELLKNCATLSTCNRSKPCSKGQMCFANYKCIVTAASGAIEPAALPAAVVVAAATTAPTKAPITSAPVSQAPVTGSPTINPHSLAPTSSPTKFALTENEVAQRLTNVNSYCASSLSEVLSTCSYLLRTCNLGQFLCPVGTSCFENIICPNPDGSAEEAVATLTVSTVPLPAMESPPAVTQTSPALPAASSESIMAVVQTPPPTFQPFTKAPILAIPPQNYCAAGDDDLETMCVRAPTCNDGDGPCPPGSFCFGGVSCPDRSEAVAVPRPSSRPISLTEVSHSLQKPNSDNDSVMASYCAPSAGRLPTVCGFAPTCNKGDGPCPAGTFCFPNVRCESSATQLPTERASQRSTPTPSSEPVQNMVSNAVVAPTTTAVDGRACNGLCLQPVDFSDNDNELKSRIDTIQPCMGTLPVQIGQLCIGTGKCGAVIKSNNFHHPIKDQGVYLQLDPAKCEEHGFLEESGVIPLTNTKGEEKGEKENQNPSEESDDATDFLQNMGINEHENKKINTSIPNHSPTTENTNHGEDYQREWDLEVDGSADIDNRRETDLTGWWLKENNAASAASAISHFVLIGAYSFSIIS